MKKVLSVLMLTSVMLTSIFTVLTVPTIASAADSVKACINQACERPVGGNASNSTLDNNAVPCKCGDANGPTINAPSVYCYGAKNVAGTLDQCLVAKDPTNPANPTTPTGLVPVPTTLTSTQGLLDKIDTIGTWIFNGLLALAGVFLIVAGYYFVTGGSEAEKIKTARTMLINALIGVTVAALSKGLVAVIRSLVS